MFLTAISVKHPVFATMVMIAILVFGVSAYRVLPIEQFPDVDFPIVAIITTYPGASPETVEREVTRPIEKAVNTIGGIDTVSSTSSAGSSSVILQFTLNTNSAAAAEDARDKIASIVNQLPSSVEAPQVLRFNPTAKPVMSLALSSQSQSLLDLTALADDVVTPALTSIPGVGSATVVGGLNNQINVSIEPDLLAAYGIGIAEVITSLQRDNITLPAGNVVDGNFVQTIQLNAEVKSVEEFSNVVIASRNGETVTIGDVATVAEGPSDVKGMAFLNGEPALALDVVKIDSGNTVAIAAAVKGMVDQLNSDGTLPRDVKIDVIQDAAEPVKAEYHTVQATLLEGAGLAVAIVFLFLNSWRSTVITALTLPISIVGTLAVLQLLGFSLNIMTMLALTLSVGILIDDAIVVRENITRHLHMGKSHFQAALDGTNEIGLAVLATTLSIVAVFLPLAFMDGIVGKFFVQFGVTVSVAVLISLFVSFTLDPMLSSVWYDPASHPNAKRGPIGKLIGLFDKGFDKLAHGYRALLRWSLGHRLVVVAVALMTLGGSVLMFPHVGSEFIPVSDESRVTIQFETAAGSSSTYTAAKAKQVETLLASRSDVTSIYTTINSGANSAENQANIELTLVDVGERPLSSTEVADELRTELGSIAGISLIVNSSGGFGSGSPIEVKLQGENLDNLAAAASDLASKMRAIPGAVDIDVSLQQAQPTIDIVADRQAASDAKVNIGSIGSALRAMLGGETASEWTDGDGNQLDVVVRLPEEMRGSVDAIADFPIAQSASGETIRLSEIAKLNPAFGPTSITRENLTRQVTITANVSGRVLGEVSADVDAATAEMDVPAGITIVQGGDSKMLGDTAVSIVTAIVLAIIFIYLVLASQFGSFLQPVAIMAALPLALSGVMAGLLVAGSTLNMYSMIGVVMLMGLVVKNAILLVDNANQHMRAGENLIDALVEAGGTRLRPIIMTTLAMIFGMVPLAIGGNQSAPMAHAVIGGLISSTLLTLVVVPVILTYVNYLSKAVRKILPKAPDDMEHGVMSKG